MCVSTVYSHQFPPKQTDFKVTKRGEVFPLKCPNTPIRPRSPLRGRRRSQRSQFASRLMKRSFLSKKIRFFLRVFCRFGSRVHKTPRGSKRHTFSENPLLSKGWYSLFCVFFVFDSFGVTKCIWNHLFMMSFQYCNLCVFLFVPMAIVPS